MLVSLIVKSTTKSKSSLTVMTQTPFLLKKSVILVQSLRRNSSAWGWSCSTDCDTSIMYAFPLWYLGLIFQKIKYQDEQTNYKFKIYSILNSDRSAWTSLQSWNIRRIKIIVSLYNSRAFDSLSSTSLKLKHKNWRMVHVIN